MPQDNGAYRIDGREAPADLGPGYVWKPERYERAVLFHIDVMRRTETARIVEKFAGLGGKRILIQPERSSKRDNAGEFHGAIRFTPGFYTGGVPGIRARGRYRYLNSGEIVSTAIGYEADEVLFHEVFHAMRSLTKSAVSDWPEADVQVTNYLTAAVDREHADDARRRYLWFDDFEEFAAVAVTNVYISEKHNRKRLMSTFARTGGGPEYSLRKDHYGGHTSIVPLSSPLAFHRHPEIAPLLARLRTSQRLLFEELALVAATFNPLRDHLIAGNPGRMAASFLKKFDSAAYRRYEFYEYVTGRLKTELGEEVFGKMSGG